LLSSCSRSEWSAKTFEDPASEAYEGTHVVYGDATPVRRSWLLLRHQRARLVVAFPEAFQARRVVSLTWKAGAWSLLLLSSANTTRRLGFALLLAA
jgi:hypothetical protein